MYCTENPSSQTSARRLGSVESTVIGGDGPLNYATSSNADFVVARVQRYNEIGPPHCCGGP